MNLSNKAMTVVLGLSMIWMPSCNSTNAAQKAQAVIQAILNVAVAETVVLPVQDQAAYRGYIGLAQTLDSQLGTCVQSASGVMIVGKNAKFLSCFNVFAQGLLSPAELAQLRILSPASQQKVQLYLTGIVAGVNGLEAALGGTPVVAPVVGPPATSSQLIELQIVVCAQVDCRYGQ